MTGIKDRGRGCLIGLAIGDALGTSVEFKERDTYDPVTRMRGGGAFNLQPGEWTDDTSMALALARSIISYKGINQVDILKNFSDWYNKGAFSHNNLCFDIGNTTRTAIDKFDKGGQIEPVCGSTHGLDSGNGGIMRLAPAPMIAKTRKQAVEYSVAQSITTHASPDCVDMAEYLGGVLWDIIDTGGTKVEDRWDVAEKYRAQISSSGYVVHTAEAAFWCVEKTESFKDAVLLAANLGDDADTVAAVTGQIAGAFYGYSNIPKEWLEVLAWHDKILKMADIIMDYRST